jgi:hypothetical protein
MIRPQAKYLFFVDETSKDDERNQGRKGGMKVCEWCSHINVHE